MLLQLQKFKTPKRDVTLTPATIAVIDVFGFNLKLKGWKFGLHHCFTDESRVVRRNIATDLEYVVHTVRKKISSKKLESFHEYLRKMTNKFTQKIHHAKENTS